MKQFWNVLSFSYKEKVLGKGFWIITVIITLLIFFIINIPSLYKAIYKEEKEKIKIIDETGTVFKNDEALNAELSKKIEWSLAEPENESSIKNDILNDKLDGLVIIHKDNSFQKFKVEYVVKRMMGSKSSEALMNYFQILHVKNVCDSLSLSVQEYNVITSKVSFDFTELKKNTRDTFFAAYFMIMLLYISILSYGGLVASSVAAEKSSRVMELLITSVRPIWLLFGKIIGVGLVGMTQFAIFALNVFIFTRFIPIESINLGGMTLNFSSISFPTFISLMVFFLLGYFLYATIYAALGSLANKSEDISMVTILPVFLIIISFFGAMYSSIYPDTSLARVLSFIPISSPMVMFARMCVSEVPIVETLLAILLLVFAIAFVGWVSAKIYRVGVLLYGKMPTFKEVYFAVKNYKV